jgi:PBP1b-binding outer membrane lipoprotein LpoB
VNKPLFKSRHVSAVLTLAAVSALAGCVTTSIPNASGVAPQTLAPNDRGPVGGVGIEGSDIVSMTDQMMRDMLSSGDLVLKSASPRVIIDAELFVNESSQPINKNAITDRLRVNLNRSAKGRLTFVGRHYAGAVEKERALKRAGMTDVGTTGLTRATQGVDYRLGGRITSIDSRNARTGMAQRYTQITFEMVDLESGQIVWSGLYDMSRAAADDVIYR